MRAILNSELTKSYMDFSVSSLDSLFRINMCLETKILSLSIVDAEQCAKTKFHFTGGHFENGGI